RARDPGRGAGRRRPRARAPVGCCAARSSGSATSPSRVTCPPGAAGATSRSSARRTSGRSSGPRSRRTCLARAGTTPPKSSWPTPVDWHTLRTRPAVTSDGDEENWRFDPLIAGGGVLADHGWHVFYVVQGWIGEAPQSVSARLETRRHTRWSVEDTATVRLGYAHATAEILLTWAADERRNWAAVTGADGMIEL